ncbi:MAG TPA: hypothetical protein VFK72_03245 [Nevskia sp.]|nr:hypothetical protein [Nevskia sp.]
MFDHDQVVPVAGDGQDFRQTPERDLPMNCRRAERNSTLTEAWPGPLGAIDFIVDEGEELASQRRRSFCRQGARQRWCDVQSGQ